jgi:hypothetical protein
VGNVVIVNLGDYQISDYQIDDWIGKEGLAKPVNQSTLI